MEQAYSPNQFASSPNPVGRTDLQPGDWKRFVLVFLATVTIVFIFLSIFFRPVNPAKRDNTQGAIRRSQCQAIGGVTAQLPSGHSVCKLGEVVFSLTD